MNSPGHRGGVGYIAVLKGHVSLWLKIGVWAFLVGVQALIVHWGPMYCPGYLGDKRL